MSFSKRDLQRWIDFLGAQITVFDAAYLAKMGEPHRANPTLVAFLKVNNEMAKEKVESAVIEFARSKAWPASALTGDQLVNLTHRAHSAREVLLAIQSGKLPRNAPQALQIPRSNNEPQMIKWLFIALWNRAGEPYLDALTNAYLA